MAHYLQFKKIVPQTPLFKFGSLLEIFCEMTIFANFRCLFFSSKPFPFF
jgi:hypothetical protein